ncbi:MAG TPA: sugar phosphate nucleotidyltransferase [Syntrophobacteria bacterium]|nr:sugar phosphate nucleotidyltransferase [Syntrophobacteria bacterium]
MRVAKGVIPAAGLGTRMRSLAGDLPKELLKIGEKPLIAHAVEGMARSGIAQVAVVVSPAKEGIRRALLERYPRGLLGPCELVFIMQHRPLGVADAVSRCRDFIEGEPFALVMPDNLLIEGPPVIGQLLPCFARYGLDTIGALRLAGEAPQGVGNVGFLDVEGLPDEAERMFRVRHYSDKRREPVELQPGKAVLKGFGCGVFLPHFFDLIEEWRPRLTGEVDEVPVLQTLARQGKLLGVELVGKGFDAGNPQGFQAATNYAAGCV